jgi:hypothetical protein
LKQLGILKETILQGFLIKINSLILWCGRAPLKTPLKGRIAVSFYFTCRVSPSSILLLGIVQLDKLNHGRHVQMEMYCYLLKKD